jgi:branched-chain amino acid transport system substrate-binding protein
MAESGFKSYLRGAEIAAAEVNAREGKQGIQFLLAIRWGNFSRERDLKDLREFLVAERIHFLLGQVGQESIIPIATAVQAQRVPFLVFPVDFLAAGSSGKEPSNLFWISPAPEAFQRAAVRTAAQFSENRFFLLARSSASGKSWAKYFWEELRRLKPEAIDVGELFLSPHEPDHEGSVQAILSSKANVCVSHLGVQEWRRFAKIAKAKNYFKKVVHFELESAHQEILVELQKEAPEGVWGINTFPFWFLEGRETQDFVNKYRSKTGGYPGIYALSGYGSVYALLEAMKKSASFEPEKVMEALGGLTFPTPVGALSIRKTDRRALWPIWCGVSKNVSNYPFPILKELRALGPDSFFPPTGQADTSTESTAKETSK